jgi:HD-like signal output (HDOD) protein/AmiR/NasT family two-component response regulator
MKILIVDDDPVARSLLRKQISDLAECREVDNGKAAVAAYRNSLEKNDPFQIITLDIMMPDMDGQEVLETIRGIEKEKNLTKDKKAKILMISSRSDKLTILTCVQLGCDDYLAKPFKKEVIIKKLRKLGLSIPEEKDVKEPKTLADALEDIESRRRKKTLQETITKIATRIKTGKIDLPVLPKVLKDIRAVINNPDSSVSDLEEAIKKDAVISLRVITEANSPFYGATEKINSLDLAVQRLGYEDTINVVNAIANRDLYSTEEKRLETLMEKLWLHSLASAHASKTIAEKLELENTERYFFMGIIHDIGKVLLLKALGDAYQFEDILDIDDIINTIRELHANLGGAVIKRWGLSEDYIRVAVKHPGPRFDSKTEKSILIVNLGSYIADSMGYGIRDVEESVSDLDSARILEIDEETIEDIRNETKQRVIGVSDFL